MTAHPDAPLIALAAMCETAAKRFEAASAEYARAEFAVPHDGAEEAEALRIQTITLDENQDIIMPIMCMRASSFDGVIAKARALQCAFPNDDEIAKMIAEALRVDGPFDPLPASLSLARDLLALAWDGDAKCLRR
jgi:hypothetical protein